MKVVDGPVSWSTIGSSSSTDSRRATSPPWCAAGLRSSRASAHDSIAGLMLANDFSSRDVTMAHAVLAKGRKGFCPLGPMLVTLDELDLDDVAFTVTVNGELRQSAHTSRMVHAFADII